MTKSFFLSLLLISLPSYLISQEAKPAIAILDVTPIGVEESKSKIIYSYIMDQIHRSGDFRIVERGELDKALQEVELSSSDVIDDSTAVEIGKITGAEFILLSALAAEEGNFYLSMRVIATGTAEVTKTSVKSTNTFEKVEQLAMESVKYLLGEDIETQKVGLKRENNYISVAGGFGLTLPIGAVAEALGWGYTPLINVNYNFSFAWGAIGFGIGTGINLTYTKSDRPASYGLYSIPLTAGLTYSTNFSSSLFFTVDVNFGAALTILNYLDPEINENSQTTFTSTTFFLSSKLGAGFNITRAVGLFVFGNFILMTFAEDPYLGISPGLSVVFRF